jgi:hypothetical protein
MTPIKATPQSKPSTVLIWVADPSRLMKLALAKNVPRVAKEETIGRVKTLSKTDDLVGLHSFS